MATVYSDPSTSGYNDVRIKVDYSGTSATCTMQFKRNGSYGSYGWSDPNCKITFNGTTKNAPYGDPGYVSTSWVNLGSASGYSVSITGGTYNWSITKGSGATLSGSGTVIIPSQATAPATPSCSPSSNSASLINVAWSISDLGNPTGSVSLYNGTTNNPTSLLQTKTSTGSWTFGNDQRTANTTYYYVVKASNSAGSTTSGVKSATTYPAGISSITAGSVTTSSSVLTLVFNSSGSALTTTAQISPDNSNWSNTSLTDVQGTTKTYTLSGLTANSLYTRYFRVHTTAGNSGVKSFSGYTKPNGLTSATVTSMTPHTATVSLVFASGGGALTTSAQYRVNGGAWTSTGLSNVEGTTKTFTLTNLPDDTTQTYQFRVQTAAGDSSATSVTFTTPRDNKCYVGVGGIAKNIKGGYVGVNGVAKTIKKVYVGVNNVAKEVYKKW
jgi:limonene-1,2-epoxide hydrolase